MQWKNIRTNLHTVDLIVISVVTMVTTWPLPFRGSPVKQMRERHLKNVFCHYVINNIRYVIKQILYAHSSVLVHMSLPD